MAASSFATAQYLSEACSKTLKPSNHSSVTLDLGNGQKLCGVSCIAKHVQANQCQDMSLEERMAVEQWLEYRLYIDNTHDGEAEKLVLQEVNSYLQDKVYLVAHQLSVADVLLYHSLHPVFNKLSFQEKEKFMNVSRWFNNVQQDRRSRQSLSRLPFLRTSLYEGIGSH